MGQVVQRVVNDVVPVAGLGEPPEKTTGGLLCGWTLRTSKRVLVRSHPWRRSCSATCSEAEEERTSAKHGRVSASEGPAQSRGTSRTIFEATAADLVERQRVARSEEMLAGVSMGEVALVGGPGRDGDERPRQEQDAADFRTKYLGRLSYSRTWAPRHHRPPQHQTVTIFDWDDTLLCTSFLSEYPKADVQKQLQSVAALAKQLLTQARSRGHVFIVTNASDGWVEHSCGKYMPDLLPTLGQVRIISARSKFERHFPDRADVWKVQAFLEVQRQLDADAIANLISVGDSHFEMQAIHAMGLRFAEAVVKTVKLWERPSPDDLRRELELVASDFVRIIDYPTTAKIGFERRRRRPVESPPAAPSPRPATEPRTSPSRAASTRRPSGAGGVH